MGDSPSRYQCVIDLLALYGKEKVILHVPQNVYARLSKTSALDPKSKEVHIYLGKKRSKSTVPPSLPTTSPPAPAPAAAAFTVTHRFQTKQSPMMPHPHNNFAQGPPPVPSDICSPIQQVIGDSIQHR